MTEKFESAYDRKGGDFVTGEGIALCVEILLIVIVIIGIIR